MLCGHVGGCSQCSPLATQASYPWYTLRRTPAAAASTSACGWPPTRVLLGAHVYTYAASSLSMIAMSVWQGYDARRGRESQYPEGKEIAVYTNVGSCYVQSDTDSLAIGNGYIERKWSFVAGLPAATHIIDKASGKQWIDVTQAEPYPLKGLFTGQVDIDRDDDLGLGEEAVRIRVVFAHPWGDVVWVHCIQPSAAFIRSSWEIRPGATAPDSVAADLATLADPGILDRFALAPTHVEWRSVMLRDRTDHWDNLLKEEHGLLYSSEARTAQGNLLFMEDSLDHNSLIVVKEAPTPLGHLSYPGYDFAINAFSIHVCGSGLTAGDCRAGQPVSSYGVAVGVSQGGEAGALQALHRYHRSVRRFEPSREICVMSNTWGDRTQDTRINEEFIMHDLPHAARLGVNVYQIDAGWYRRGTWEVDPVRFPRGLQPIKHLASSLGMKLGLWFVPKKKDDYAYWNDDAEILLGLYRNEGVTHFKIDDVKLPNKLAEERLVCMLRRVIAESGGNVAFNLDITNGTRLGFFGRAHYGTYFLENRYTDWANYHPHRVLRNLWTLARFLPTRYLLMEVPNVLRNQEKYANDPLAPAVCGQAYAFAVTMCSNPLIWMHPSDMDPQGQLELGALVSTYRSFQEELLQGTVLPIGQEPNGTRWTGFQSMASVSSGYLVLYRELHPASSHRFQLWELADCEVILKPVLGRGVERSIHVDTHGEAVFSLPDPFSYAVYRYQVQ
jgi:alpha-galactosidase